MKKCLTIALGALLVLSLPGCASLAGLMAWPAAVANQTALDEQGAIGVELAYKASRTAMEVAVDAGLLKGPRAAQMADLDNRAFAAVTGVRAAYRAGNASNYYVAIADARAAITAMLAAVK